MPTYKADYYTSELTDERPRTSKSFDAKDLGKALDLAQADLIEGDKRVVVEEVSGGSKAFKLGGSELDGPDVLS